MEEKLQYKKAKTWQIALATMTGAGQMVFYMLMKNAWLMFGFQHKHINSIVEF